MIAEIAELSTWGLPGAIIAALAGYVLLIEKRHYSERKEWSKSNERLQEETNKNVRENTSVLSSLKTLLENRIR